MANRRGRAVGFLQDFQNFILRGNVVDLAVAVILGGAFGKIIDSLITDVITPAMLKPALEAARVEELAKLSIAGILYGKFIAAIINFIVISFMIFILIKTLESVKRKEALQEPTTPPDPQERLIAAIERLADQMELREQP